MKQEQSFENFRRFLQRIGKWIDYIIPSVFLCECVNVLVNFALTILIAFKNTFFCESNANDALNEPISLKSRVKISAEFQISAF